MSRSRVFLREIRSSEYGLDEWREKQLEAKRVRGAERETRITEEAPGYSSGSRPRWRFSPSDDPFLTQTIQVHLTTIPARGSNKGHGHQNEAAFYILNGEGYEVHDGERYSWREGDLVYVHTDSVHRHFNDSPQAAQVLVLKAKSMWMHFGLFQQGATGAPVVEEGFGPREDWSRLWTSGVGDREKVVRSGDTPWEDTSDGRVRWLAGPHLKNHRMFSVDVLLQEIAPGSRSGRRWQMADEVYYVLSGSGVSLQWQVEAEIAEKYYARIANEPTRHRFGPGDSIYVPPSHARQMVNTGRAPLLLLAAQNRLVRRLGYDAAVMLESSSQ